MKYSSEITEILELALSGHTGAAASKLSLFISTIEYEGDVKTAKKLRKALAASKGSMIIAKPPKLYLPKHVVDKADMFIKGIKMHSVLTADGITVPTVLCIDGPSGCGKTALVEYIASALSLPIAEGDGDADPTEERLLHISGTVDLQTLKRISATGFVAAIENTDEQVLPDDSDSFMSIHIPAPDREAKKNFIIDFLKPDIISDNGMKILLELYSNASFRTIRLSAMEAKRKAALDNIAVDLPLLAESIFPYIGIDPQEGESDKEARKRKARELRERNPKVFSVQALAEVFGVPKATMHYILTK